MLSVRPQRCVTLREGQPCFVRLKLAWSSSESQDLCVYGQGEKPLACWLGSRGEELILEQSLLESTRYSLRDATGEELVSTEVTVAWVYKTRRSRRRWRLF
jgi:hypothetical protein